MSTESIEEGFTGTKRSIALGVIVAALSTITAVTSACEVGGGLKEALATQNPTTASTYSPTRQVYSLISAVTDNDSLILLSTVPIGIAGIIGSVWGITYTVSAAQARAKRQ